MYSDEEKQDGLTQSDDSSIQSLSTLTRCHSQQGSILVVEPSVKLRCCVYLLSLIAIGFIVTLVETESNEPLSPCIQLANYTTNATSSQFNPWQWDAHKTIKKYVCLSMKCVYFLFGIAAVIYLERAVLVEGEIPEAIASHATQKDRLVLLRNAPRYIRIPKQFGGYPSTLFILTFLFFSIALLLESAIDSTCGIIDSVTEPGENLPDVFRRTFLTIFVVLQTKLFMIHYRHSAQWKLSATWFCGCQLMATNIASWFFNVGLELHDLDAGSKGTHRNQNNSSFCKSNGIIIASHLLYPFGVEYYVMSALMAFNFVAKAGCLGNFLRKHFSEQTEAQAQQIHLRSLLRSTPSPGNVVSANSEFSIIRRNFWSFFFGLGLTILSLLVSTFVLFGEKDSVHPIIRCVFLGALILMYLCGVVCSSMLLFNLKRNSTDQISMVHLTDRSLLWLGAAAIAINELNKIWITTIGISDDETIEDILLVTSSALNIYQSLMQIYVIECALLWKFPVNRNQGVSGRALFNLLILINAAEWIINTSCFGQFFIQVTGNSKMLSLATMPLQVFFRFHSATCIHEFKKHCQPHHETESANSVAASATEVTDPRLQQNLVVEFASMTSLIDTIYRRRSTHANGSEEGMP